MSILRSKATKQVSLYSKPERTEDKLGAERPLEKPRPPVTLDPLVILEVFGGPFSDFDACNNPCKNPFYGAPLVVLRYLYSR